MNAELNEGDSIKIKGHDGKWLSFNNTKNLLVKEVQYENKQVVGVTIEGSEEPIELKYREWKFCTMSDLTIEQPQVICQKSLKAALWKDAVIACMSGGKSLKCSIETADRVVNEYETRF